MNQPLSLETFIREKKEKKPTQSKGKYSVSDGLSFQLLLFITSLPNIWKEECVDHKKIMGYIINSI